MNKALALANHIVDATIDIQINCGGLLDARLQTTFERASIVRARFDVAASIPHNASAADHAREATEQLVADATAASEAARVRRNEAWNRCYTRTRNVLGSDYKLHVRAQRWDRLYEAAQAITNDVGKLLALADEASE